MNKYYTGEQVHIHIKSLINVTQYNNRVNVKGKSPLFCGNGKQVITIYDLKQGQTILIIIKKLGCNLK